MIFAKVVIAIRKLENSIEKLAKLVITLPEEPFMKRGLYFIGPIKLVGRLTGNKYILGITNYATKWVEEKTFITNIAIVTTRFL
jgi:hypothetical protein